jgi:hypothetical protein
MNSPFLSNLDSKNLFIPITGDKINTVPSERFTTFGNWESSCSSSWIVSERGFT